MEVSRKHFSLITGLLCKSLDINNNLAAPDEVQKNDTHAVEENTQQNQNRARQTQKTSKVAI